MTLQYLVLDFYGEVLMRMPASSNLYGAPRAGIRFNNHIFTEPVLFSMALPPVSSGIYSILIDDASCMPRPFRVIYFGESLNFSQRVTADHECFHDWTFEAGGPANLYVAFCPTPLLKEQQRRWVQSDLIAHYRPACNLKDNQAQSFYQPLLSMAK